MSFSQDPFLYDVLNFINYINYNTSFKTVLLTLYEFDNKSKKFKLNFKNYKKIKRKKTGAPRDVPWKWKLVAKHWHLIRSEERKGWNKILLA